MSDDGLLSQDDIDAALAAAGLEAGGTPEPRPAGMAAAAEPAPAPAATESRVDSSGRAFDAVAAEMAAAIAAESGPRPAAPSVDPVPASPFRIPDLGGAVSMSASQIGSIDLLRDVQLNVKIELGRSRMLVDDVLRLGEGSVVELDKLAGDPVDVFVNDRLVARGEVLVLNDNFCVRINDIVKPDQDQDED